MFLKQCEITQDTSRLTARIKVLTFDGNNEFLCVYILRVQGPGGCIIIQLREIIRIMRRYGLLAVLTKNSKRKRTVTVSV
jgi:hypothetical protein